jgi:hypothetical protein
MWKNSPALGFQEIHSGESSDVEHTRAKEEILWPTILVSFTE